LYYVSLAGLSEIVGPLLDRGADVNAKGGLQDNALQVASHGGHDKIVQMLLDRGADVDTQGGYYGSALQAASVGGHHKIVHILLDKGARLTTKVLFSVLLSNSTTIITLLLPYLAEDLIFERDADNGRTPLHWAAELGYQALTNCCLDLGAEVDAADESGETALHYAAENGQLNIVQILIQASADRTILDFHGRTALNCAQGVGPDEGRRSYPDIVAYLQQ
jgi:ankyrin repeat protein